jgi:hypothetical protein
LADKSEARANEIIQIHLKSLEKSLQEELLDLCIVFRYSPEQVTQSQKHWMQKQYSNWRQNR